MCVSLGCFYGPNILEPIVRDWNPNYHNEIAFGPPIPLPFTWKIPFFFFLSSISSAQEKEQCGLVEIIRYPITLKTGSLELQGRTCSNLDRSNIPYLEKTKTLKSEHRVIEDGICAKLLTSFEESVFIRLGLGKVYTTSGFSSEGISPSL